VKLSQTDFENFVETVKIHAIPDKNEFYVTATFPNEFDEYVKYYSNKTGKLNKHSFPEDLKIVIEDMLKNRSKQG
jgi:hypothetical protein